jgi:hypothetical protein
MIVEDYDVDVPSDDDEAPLTKSYGACAGASRLRLDPPDPKRRRRRGYLRLLTGLGCALTIGGVLHVVFRLGPYRGKEQWRRRGYRHATHAPTPAPPAEEAGAATTTRAKRPRPRHPRPAGGGDHIREKEAAVGAGQPRKVLKST